MDGIILMNILIFYLTATSAAATRGVSHNPDYPGKCVVKDSNVILSPGDEFNDPQRCLNIKCRENSVVELYSCGSMVAAPTGCMWGKHIEASAPFPKCCPRETICNN